MTAEASPITAFLRAPSVAPLVPPAPALLALVIFAVAMWPPALLNDPDTLWHIRTGEWMLDHRAILHADPFSFTRAGAPWTTHEWLTEIMMAAVYRAGGFNGLMLATAAAAAASVFVLARFAARHVEGLALFLLVMLGMSLAGPHLLARPHFFALPVLAIWMSALTAARSEDRAPPLPLIAVMALWANMHASFIFGLGLVGVFALEALVAAPPTQRQKVLSDWGRFGVAATIAALATPHGIEGLLFPVKLILMPGITGIAEWAPADFATLAPLEIAVLAAVYALIRLRAEVPIVRLLLLLFLLHMTLQHQRYEMQLGVVAVFLLADPIGRALGAHARGALPPARWPALTTMLVAAIALAGFRLAAPEPPIGGGNAPIEALAAVPPELAAKPVLNDYSAGGYLIWNGVKPFIDGRADMYGAEYLDRYFDIASGNEARLSGAIADYRIEWTLFRSGGAAANAMDAMPGWTQLHKDERYVVHVRRDRR